MKLGGRDVVGLGLGAALGHGAGEVTRRLGPRQAVIGGAVGLVVAAAIYPAARRSFQTGGVLGEVAVVVATTGLGLAASRLDSAAGRRLVAAGWASHVLFDTLQGSSEDSRLPAFYPALCAGYDVAYAARLLR
jgi:hypothetical protein